MLLRCSGKEPLSGCNVTPFAQEKGDGSTLLIDGPIQVDPLASDFEVSLIHAPPTVRAYRLQRFSNSGTNAPPHRKMVVWVKVMPRSAII
jgi:hypothetical protein